MAGHPPSQARAVVQRLKAGRLDVEEVLAEAAAIEEPSFAAEAIFAVAGDLRVPAPVAARLASQTVELVHAVERDWRKAELIAHLGQRLGRWREGDPQRATGAQRLAEGLAQAAMRLEGKDLSAAARGLAGAVEEPQAARLLQRVLGHGADPAADARAILDAHGGAEVAAVVAAVGDPALRARLTARAGARSPQAVASALEQAAQADPAQRLEAYRAVIAGIASPDALAAVEQRLPAEPELRARLLCALAVRADRLGQAHRARDWFDQAAQLASGLPEKAREAVVRNVTAGLERLGARPPSKEPQRAPPAPARPAAATPDAARDDEPGRMVAPTAPGPTATTVASTGPASMAAAPRASGPTTAAVPPSVAASMQRNAGGGRLRHALALYDSYEGRLSDVHLRAVARAAPLCLAFGLDLVLVGFPAQDARELAQAVGRASRVGGGADPAISLAAEGRLLLVPAAKGQAPTWRGLGYPVATTSTPESGKQGSLEQAAAAAARDGGRVLLVMGLGHSGLPPAVLRSCPLHYEITGANVSLETATAMGILAERLRQVPVLGVGAGRLPPRPQGAPGHGLDE